MANYTDAQKQAYGAGMGYGYAKANKRVPVKPENKESFRAGLDKARGKKPVEKKEFSKAEKIQHYSKRLDDPKLSARQRSFAARRLRDLSK